MVCKPPHSPANTAWPILWARLPCKLGFQDLAALYIEPREFLARPASPRARIAVHRFELRDEGLAQQDARPIRVGHCVEKPSGEIVDLAARHPACSLIVEARSGQGQCSLGILRLHSFAGRKVAQIGLRIDVKGGQPHGVRRSANWRAASKTKTLNFGPGGMRLVGRFR